MRRASPLHFTASKQPGNQPTPISPQHLLNSNSKRPLFPPLSLRPCCTDRPTDHNSGEYQGSFHFHFLSSLNFLDRAVGGLPSPARRLLLFRLVSARVARQRRRRVGGFGVVRRDRQTDRGDCEGIVLLRDQVSQSWKRRKNEGLLVNLFLGAVGGGEAKDKRLLVARVGLLS